MAAKVKYNPDYHDNWAWSLAAMGATNEEIAKAMGVSKRTIIRWSQITKVSVAHCPGEGSFRCEGNQEPVSESGRLRVRGREENHRV